MTTGAPASSTTVGVDLAAEPKGTGLAVVEWRPGGATLARLELGVTDADIVEAMTGGAALGLDCPVGWPDAFVDMVVAHRRGDRIEGGGGADWRRTLVYRATDRVVHERTGRWPLSVSADRLGVTAMRGASLLTALGDAGAPTDRATRSGRVFEVYLGAALTLWRFDKTGYRVDPERRRVLLEGIRRRAGWLDLGDHAEVMVRSADAFDAVIAALVTRAAVLGRFAGPPPDLADQASREGWIVLPDGDLVDLVDVAEPSDLVDLADLAEPSD